MMQKLHFKYINHHLNSPYTIVFIHEGLGCIEAWRTYPQRLCNKLGLQGIVYDRAGYGQSKGNLNDRSDEYLIEAADELETFLNVLKLKNVVLYGHSDGGSIALAFAAKYPNKLKCLISEAAHVLNEPETIIGIKATLKAYKLGKLDGLKKWHGSNYKGVFNAWAHTWLRPSFNLETLKNILPLITVNQLIIQGQNDQYGSADQYLTIADLTNGKSTIFTPNCGHAPFLENESEVLSKVVPFINYELNGIL